jgi:hypothetical protein
MSFGPFSALYFTFYEYAKGKCVENDPKAFLNKVHSDEKTNAP